MWELCSKNWSCGKKKVAYSHHNCARYEAPTEVQHVKNSLHRHAHYYSRYKGHKDSMKLEAKLEKKIKSWAKSFEQNKPKPQNFNWLKNGAYRLFRARHILSYSYVFAFYLFGNDLFKGEMTETDKRIKQNLFEDQQQQLEARVEQLSGLMEQPFHTYIKE
ncbi:putative E3 ubiquitin-protein ligase ARI2 [Bienertia sinuspersici]